MSDVGSRFCDQVFGLIFFLGTAFGGLAAEQGLQVELLTVYPSGPHSAGDRIRRAAHVPQRLPHASTNH
jgi:hypothetical protein